MIRDAIEYIVGLGKREQVTVNGVEYTSDRLEVIKEPQPAALQVSTLSSVVDYLKANFDAIGKVIINVEKYDRVSVYSALSNTQNRKNYIVATASVPHSNFDRFLDVESFIIWIQSGFVPNEDSEIVLKVVGNIKEEAVNSYGDDGISQSVTAKAGVATVANVVVPNPVHLQPYRSFIEIQQPLTKFIFRMQNGPKSALFEADGGAWKVTATNNIRQYLLAELEEEIVAGQVTVIA